MIEHVLETARSASPQTLAVVVGHGATELREALVRQPDLTFVVQEPQLGTAHALLTTEPRFPRPERVARAAVGRRSAADAGNCSQICSIATPRPAAAATVLTAVVDDPTATAASSGPASGLHVLSRNGTPAQQSGPFTKSIRHLCVRPGRAVRGAARHRRRQRAARVLPARHRRRFTGRAGGCVETMTVANPKEVAGINSRSELAAVKPADESSARTGN